MANYTGGKIMENMNRAYDFFTEWPRSPATDMALEFGIPQSSARTRINVMVRFGYLRADKPIKGKRGMIATYSAVKGRRPDGSDPVLTEANQQSGAIKRKFGPAIQIGMPAYADLPAGFFGQVGA